MPVYAGHDGTTLWCSNVPGKLREVVGDAPLQREVLAELLHAGWSLSGRPVWANLTRLPADRLLRIERGAWHAIGDALMPPARDLFGRGFSEAGAAASLTALIGAAASARVGSPVDTPLTGGRDSRLVLAATRAAGVATSASTAAFPFELGWPATEDVAVATRLARSLDITLHVDEIAWDRTVFADLRASAAQIATMQPGTLSLADVLTFRPTTGAPSRLVMSGLGGELSRAFYKIGDGLDRAGLTRMLVRRVGGWSATDLVLNSGGDAAVRRAIENRVDALLEEGVDPADVPDGLYQTRMANWAGPSTALFGLHQVTFAPLWTRAMLPHHFGLSRHDRAKEELHRRVLMRLAPSLADMPFAGGVGWPAATPRPSGWTVRQRRRVGGRLARERARAHRKLREKRAITDGFDRVRSQARDAALALPINHPLWDVADRKASERLLSRPSIGLDVYARQRVWWLATAALLGEPTVSPASATSSERPVSPLR
jgi:hypothetical protein